jgi:hypothetical protein
VVRRVGATLHHDLRTQFLERELQAVNTWEISVDINDFQAPMSQHGFQKFRSKKSYDASLKGSLLQLSLLQPRDDKFNEVQGHKRGSGDCVLTEEPMHLVFSKCRQRTQLQSPFSKANRSTYILQIRSHFVGGAKLHYCVNKKPPRERPKLF